MTLTADLIHAAELLDIDAQAEEDSCAIGKRLWTCADCPGRKPGGECPAKANVTERRAIATVIRAHARYVKANPLGGPAKVFDAIADRIRAGESRAAVLYDYDLKDVSRRKKK